MKADHKYDFEGVLCYAPPVISLPDLKAIK